VRPAFHPTFADLPAEIAVFPLTGALLLPGAKLPLNIFEPRYLAMAQDSLAQGRMFGMIQPNAAEPRVPQGPGLYRVGCLGRLSQFAETEDGRLLITLTGLIRFAIVAEIEGRHGYRRVRADFAAFAADLDHEAEADFDRDSLEAAMRAYFRAQGIDANWDAIGGTPDAMLVSTLSMACPFEPREKQALLEAHDASERARMLVALLEIGAASPRDAGPPDDAPRQRPS
jgi:Lon protease-like protein